METSGLSPHAQIILALMWAVVTRHVWLHRGSVVPTCRFGMSWIMGDGRIFQDERATVLNKRRDELRIRLVRQGLSYASHIFVLQMSSIMLRETDFLGGAVHRGTWNMFFYFLCHAASTGSIPLTSRFIDGLYALFHLSLLFRAWTMTNDPAYLVVGPQRAMARTAAAVMYMDVRKSMFWNVILSAMIFYKCDDNMNQIQKVSEFQHLHLCYNSDCVELIVCVLVAFSCACTRWISDVCLTAQLDAEDGQNAVHHLLTVLCDAVIRVTASGHITAPTPHFYHLLQADTSTNLEGTCFTDYLASESDQLDFQTALNNRACAQYLPTALHVNMCCRSGPTVAVQILFANLHGPHGFSGYLIGLRATTQMLREAEVDAPGSPPRQAVHTSIGQTQVPGSRTKSSVASTSSVNGHALTELESIQFRFDGGSDAFIVHRCSIDTAGKPGPSGVHPSSGSAPSLEHWVHPSMWESFRTWAQESMNALANNAQPPADYGSLVLLCPTLSTEYAFLVAQSVALQLCFASEDGDSAADSSLSEGAASSSGEIVGCQIATLKLQVLSQLPASGLRSNVPAWPPISEVA